MYKSQKVLILLSVLIFSAGSLFGQSSADTPVNISVKKALSITPVSGDLNFGTMLYGSSSAATITPDLGAKFLIAGSEVRDINVTYSNVSLLNSFGGDPLTFTPEVKETGSSSAYATGGNILNSGVPVSTGLDGNLYVWVGGSINFDASTPEGEYAGTFTMSIAYN